MKPKDMLAHVTRDFDTVELNRPFYHLLKRKACEDRRDSAPEGFVYCVKGSRSRTCPNDMEAPVVGDAMALKEIVSEK